MPFYPFGVVKMPVRFWLIAKNKISFIFDDLGICSLEAILNWQYLRFREIHESLRIWRICVGLVY